MATTTMLASIILCLAIQLPNALALPFDFSFFAGIQHHEGPFEGAFFPSRPHHHHFTTFPSYTLTQASTSATSVALFPTTSSTSLIHTAVVTGTGTSVHVIYPTGTAPAGLYKRQHFEAADFGGVWSFPTSYPTGTAPANAGFPALPTSYPDFTEFENHQFGGPRKHDGHHYYPSFVIPSAATTGTAPIQTAPTAPTYTAAPEVTAWAQ